MIISAKIEKNSIIPMYRQNFIAKMVFFAIFARQIYFLLTFYSIKGK